MYGCAQNHCEGASNARRAATMYPDHRYFLTVVTCLSILRQYVAVRQGQSTWRTFFLLPVFTTRLIRYYFSISCFEFCCATPFPWLVSLDVHSASKECLSRRFFLFRFLLVIRFTSPRHDLPYHPPIELSCYTFSSWIFRFCTSGVAEAEVDGMWDNGIRLLTDHSWSYTRL